MINIKQERKKRTEIRGRRVEDGKKVSYKASGTEGRGQKGHEGEKTGK